MMDKIYFRDYNQDVWNLMSNIGCILGSSIILVLLLFLAHLYFVFKKRNEILWGLPGSKGNAILVSVAIIKSIFNQNMINPNVLTFQSICGVFKLFYGEKLVRIWLFFRPIIILYTPQSIETILSSSTTLEKNFAYRFLGPWFKSGLITSKGAKWRTRRKLLTPSFHFRILEDFLPVIDYHSRVLVQNLKLKVGTEPLDIVYWVTMCTLDILCESAMGKQINAQRNGNNPYLKSLRKASEIFLSRISKPWLWPDLIFSISTEGRTFKRCIDTMCNFSRNVICERKRELLSEFDKEKSFVSKNAKKRKAFLDLLLHHHLQDGSLTEEDVREEVDTFMFAGHDTTAVGMSWTLYSIGMHPNVQKKIHQEIDSIFGDDKEREITLQDLKQLKYLECTIKESQRLYPSLPLIGREIREDLMINGLHVPKGTSCLLATYLLHRNPDIYPNPEVFNPDRFLPENSIGRHPYAYIPFSAGPRNCIGQRFAMMELKAVIAYVMRNFTIRSLDHPDKLHLTAEMVLRCSGGLRITLENR